MTRFTKTICLDFDGVIHSYTTPWDHAAVIPDPPVDGAFAFIAQALEQGFAVAVFSTRSHHREGIGAMMDWMHDHGMPEDVLEQLNFPQAKPPAVIYIDDRGLCFTGKFPSIEFIDNFRPWNKA